MKTIKQSALLSFVVIAFTSCTHYYYLPAAQNVPMFKGKSELHVNGGAAVSDWMEGVDFQAAYSCGANTAVMLSYSGITGGSMNKYESGGKGQFTEGGFGYYNSFGGVGVAELFGGAGYSWQYHQYEAFTMYSVNRTSELQAYHLFLQPSVGLKSDFIDVAFTPRMTWFSFNYINSVNYEDVHLNNLHENRNFLLFEPGLTIRRGWRNFKIQYQIVSSHRFYNKKVPFETIRMSLGLSINIGPLKNDTESSGDH